MSQRRVAVTKQKWTEEEEAALRAGVAKYDVGKWRYIQKDEVFGPILINRSNVDLKDKWRNLNMESPGSRGDRRGSAAGDRSAGNRRKRKKRPERASEAVGRAQDAGAAQTLHDFSSGAHASDRRKRRRSVRMVEEEIIATPPEPAAQKQPVPITDEMILAALISLQDPNGSHADDICQWIEDNYEIGSSVKRTVKWTLKRMMEAGRVAPGQGNNGLYKLAGVPRQLAEDAAHWPPDEDDDYGQEELAASTAKEAAEAAARAIAEAEEAADLATELIATADRYDREEREENGLEDDFEDDGRDFHPASNNHLLH